MTRSVFILCGGRIDLSVFHSRGSNWRFILAEPDLKTIEAAPCKAVGFTGEYRLLEEHRGGSQFRI
jgi:hypothetical protein